jgi:hypothetical protein
MTRDRALVGNAVALAVALYGGGGVYQAPPPPYFLTAYHAPYAANPAAIQIAGNVTHPEVRMFRILRDR